jgi:hypothetical protein
VVEGEEMVQVEKDINIKEERQKKVEGGHELRQNDRVSDERYRKKKAKHGRRDDWGRGGGAPKQEEREG